jgi:hypothetical protein
VERGINRMDIESHLRSHKAICIIEHKERAFEAWLNGRNLDVSHFF